MALLFVRHAQASYGTDDYDRLSPLGWTQAGHLGTWLAREPHGFARARVGAMRRHRENYEAIRRAFAEAGHPLPEPEEDADLNEFDHGAVIRAYLVERADAVVVEAALEHERLRQGATVLDTNVERHLLTPRSGGQGISRFIRVSTFSGPRRA
jgi:broad specificity phosphatase PhoE